jgi:hypothetical protein
VVGPSGEQIDGVVSECREVSAGDLFSGGPALFAAAAFGFAA